MRYRVRWPDGDTYEENGARVFSRAKALAVVASLAGTIAGDAAIEPASEEEDR